MDTAGRAVPGEDLRGQGVKGITLVPDVMIGFEQ